MIPIIIVDDEPNIIKWLSNQVRWEDYGYQVVGEFLDGQEVLDFLPHHQVQLMITDIRMPGMDGLELIHRVRSLYPGMRIIIISAHSEFSYAKEAIRMGVEDYLLKPIDNNELLEALVKIRGNISSNVQADDPETFRNNFLNRWLHSVSLDYTFKLQAEAAGLVVSANPYMTVVFQPLSVASGSQSWLRQVRKAMEGETCYFLPQHDHLVCILENPEPEYRQTLSRICQGLNEADVETVMSVGPVANRYNDLFMSYDMACRYLPVIRMTEEMALFCEDYAKDLHAAPRYKIGIQRLKQLIHEKNLSQVLALLDQLLSTAPGEEFQLAISLVAHTLEHVRDDSTSKPDTAEVQQMQLRFRSLHDPDKIRDWMRSFFQKLCRTANNNTQFIHPRVRDCLSIIHDRYPDSNLGLKGIAEQLGVSTAYLGQMFKSQTGKYFNDYLSDVRLDAVYHLLLETEDSVGSIAAQAGFTTQSYMNRLFKACYKVSPNEARYLFRLPER